MRFRGTNLSLGLAAVLIGHAQDQPAASGQPRWPFFAMQTATRGDGVLAAEQVRETAALGYDGIGAVPLDELPAFAQACNREGARLWSVYLTFDVAAPPKLDPGFAASLEPLKGRDGFLWIGLTHAKLRPSDPAGDADALPVLTRLADIADSLGSRVALYPHAGFWLERTDDAVRLARKTGRDNVGATFNLCHFLNVDDEARLEEVLHLAASRLMAVSLNGAETGRPGAGWNELIQTLDRGSFDNLRLLRALVEIGYNGPVGFQGYGIGGDPKENLARTARAWRQLNERLTLPGATNAARWVFRPAEAGGFSFDTGVLRGALHADGKSLGLTGVEHVPSGARLDRGNGLLSHYRVFTRGVRYGPGAWDWPSTARLLDSGAVEVSWPEAEGRPFSMRARYRWLEADTVEVQTTVNAHAKLAAFEVFLASYFDPSFTNALALVKADNARLLAEATVDRGDWQMFPRDANARALIQDGRWQLEPHPVAWVFPYEFAGPWATAVRRAESHALSATLLAPADDCFALAMPHQTEGHYSVYLSLFGHDIEAGETASVTARLSVRPEERHTIPARRIESAQ